MLKQFVAIQVNRSKSELIENPLSSKTSNVQKKRSTFDEFLDSNYDDSGSGASISEVDLYLNYRYKAAEDDDNDGKRIANNLM